MNIENCSHERLGSFAVSNSKECRELQSDVNEDKKQEEAEEGAFQFMSQENARQVSERTKRSEFSLRCVKNKEDDIYSQLGLNV